MEQFNDRENRIDFISKRTNLPRDIVKILAEIPVPDHWADRIKSVLEIVNHPEALERRKKLINDTEHFIRNLPVQELQQMEELKTIDEYVKRLQAEGGAALEQANEFAGAMFNWHIHVEEVIIEALNRSKEK